MRFLFALALTLTVCSTAAAQTFEGQPTGQTAAPQAVVPVMPVAPAPYPYAYPYAAPAPYPYPYAYAPPPPYYSPYNPYYYPMPVRGIGLGIGHRGPRGFNGLYIGF